MTQLPTPEEMTIAIARRDESFIGVFVVAVKSTGIFCRPGCPARTPLPVNMEFFATSRDALHAGYRPCKRCRPLDPTGRPPGWVSDLMATIEADPRRRILNKELRERGVDPGRARRYFQQKFGMTFQAYCRAQRMGLALKSVRAGQDVVTTGMDHGYDSDSGFRDAFESIIGQSPSRADRANVLTCRWIDSPLGGLLGVSDDTSLQLLEFVDRRQLATQIERVQRLFNARLVPGDTPVLRQTVAELDEYFRGERRGFTVPLDLKGTEFQERAWRALLQIPYGETRSYQQQALAIDAPAAVRAVGRANGDNRIAIIVPCHRVVAADGSLHGYGGGLWRKKRLLELESGQNSLL